MQVTRHSWRRGGRLRDTREAGVEDALDRPVRGVSSGEGEFASGVHALGAMALGEPQDALGGAQVVQHVDRQEIVDTLATDGPQSAACLRHQAGVRMRKATLSGG